MKTMNQIKAWKSVRKTWDFCPIERKVDSKKNYSRKTKFQKNNNPFDI